MYVHVVCYNCLGFHKRDLAAIEHVIHAPAGMHKSKIALHCPHLSIHSYLSYALSTIKPQAHSGRYWNFKFATWLNTCARHVQLMVPRQQK